MSGKDTKANKTSKTPAPTTPQRASYASAASKSPAPTTTQQASSASAATKATKAPAPRVQSTGVRAPATRTVNGGALPTGAPTGASTLLLTAPPGLPPPGVGQTTRLPKAPSVPLDSDGAGPAPPPTLTKMLENLQPQPDLTLPIGARRLVMEQLREDQGIRIPWGWNENKWVIIKEFKKGYPVWESHIFWGKFVQDGIEVVRVRPQRQLIFYSQYRFLQELPTLYLESISKAPEATKTIAEPRILPQDQHVPTNTPYVMGRGGFGCRMPSLDENIPIDMYPRFEAVLRPDVRKVGQAHVDTLLLIAHRLGFIAKPEMVYYKTDETGLGMMPMRLNPVFEEPVMQYRRNAEPVSVHDLPLSTTDLTESIHSLELHSIPSSKAASVRNDAGEDVLGESDKEEGPGLPATAPIPPTNQQKAPPRMVTTAGSTSSKKKDAPLPATTAIPPTNQQEVPPLDDITSNRTPDKKEEAPLPAPSASLASNQTEKLPSTSKAASSKDVSTAIPVESIHDLLTAIEELSDSDDDGEETGGVVNAETMTAMVSEKLEKTPAATLDDIVEAIQDVQEDQDKKLKKKKKGPPVPRKLRETRQQERAMEQLLAKDPALQLTLSSFPDVMAHYIEQQEAARKLFFSNKKIPEQLDEAIKDVLFYVNEKRTMVWSEQEDNARVFITERKNYHRIENNVKEFFLWREFEALLELPEVLVQDMYFLAHCLKGNQLTQENYDLQESQYFTALFRMKELGALLTKSEEQVNWNQQDVRKVYKENMEQYLHYMSILRRIPAGFNINSLNPTCYGELAWHYWNETKDSFLARKKDKKKRAQENFLGQFANLHLEFFCDLLDPQAASDEAVLRIGVDLLKTAEYHPVFAFDCFCIQKMIKKFGGGEKASKDVWFSYFHEVFKTERNIEDIKK